LLVFIYLFKKTSFGFFLKENQLSSKPWMAWTPLQTSTPNAARYPLWTATFAALARLCSDTWRGAIGPSLIHSARSHSGTHPFRSGTRPGPTLVPALDCCPCRSRSPSQRHVARRHWPVSSSSPYVPCSGTRRSYSGTHSRLLPCYSPGPFEGVFGNFDFWFGLLRLDF